MAMFQQHTHAGCSPTTFWASGKNDQWQKRQLNQYRKQEGRDTSQQAQVAHNLQCCRKEGPDDCSYERQWPTAHARELNPSNKPVKAVLTTERRGNRLTCCLMSNILASKLANPKSVRSAPASFAPIILAAQREHATE